MEGTTRLQPLKPASVSIARSRLTNLAEGSATTGDESSEGRDHYQTTVETIFFKLPSDKTYDMQIEHFDDML